MRQTKAIAEKRNPGPDVWSTVLRWIGKLRSKHSPRRLHVAESLAIGEKRQLLIVKCGSRELLIGAAGNFLTTLAELQSSERKKSPCA